jgi:pimeloyl-ACP methyl ester carboxylesterase
VPVAFVITNSGPGVSPATQERYSLANKPAQGREADALTTYDAVVAVMRKCPTLEKGLEQLDAADVASALSRITVPVLAIFGAADEVTPPHESVVALREADWPSSFRWRSSRKAITDSPTGTRRVSSTATSTASSRS